MYFCPKQGQDFKPPAAPLYPNMGQVPPPGQWAPGPLHSKEKMRVFLLQEVLFALVVHSVGGSE